MNNRKWKEVKTSCMLCFLCLCLSYCNDSPISANSLPAPAQPGSTAGKFTYSDTSIIDTIQYYQKLLQLVHNNPSHSWPVQTPYPMDGAILPFKRIVAYYGNLYSKGMGILGQLPPGQMLTRLEAEVASWREADTTTPVQPALHYIAVTAQRSPGPGNKYRLRMPADQIDKILEMAEKINAIVFLDIQVGNSSLMEEIPPLKKYLSLPNVHLGVDPEFSMKNGKVPGTAIGSFDASDINYAVEYLAKLVTENNLPPKILVVHRFTKAMVTNYKKIKTIPEVQMVMNMDGFGPRPQKLNTYKYWIAGEPVQFTGFKLFYNNDTKNKQMLMQPKEILKLYPQPVYIQYQ